MQTDDISEMNILDWLEKADEVTNILLKVIRGVWEPRDLAEVVSIWSTGEGLHD